MDLAVRRREMHLVPRMFWTVFRKVEYADVIFMSAQGIEGVRGKRRSFQIVSECLRRPCRQ